MSNLVIIRCILIEFTYTFIHLLKKKAIWLIWLFPFLRKGYSCVVMAHLVTDLWKNCLQNINRLSSCSSFFCILWFVHCFRQWTHLQDDSFWRKTCEIFPCQKKCSTWGNELRNILHLCTFIFNKVYLIAWDSCVRLIRFNDVLWIYSNVFEHVKWICA